uniref:carbonic anhydrase n=1 Tax=Aceria tosichella TaxID=561515 RepID=A0A6G1SBA9_9ACAR
MILATGMHSRMRKFSWSELSSMRVSTHGATSTTTTTTTTSSISSSHSRRKCCNAASSRTDDDDAVAAAAACYRKRACHHDDEASSIGKLRANDAANVSRARKTKSKPHDQGQGQRDTIRWERLGLGRRRLAGLGGTTCSGRRHGQQLMVLASVVCQMTLMILLLLALGISESESFFIDVKQSPQTSEWNYGDQMRWRQMHRDCAGRAQSPIDIKHKNVIISQHLRLNFYNYDQQIRFKLANAHHTIKMNPLGPAYEQEFEQHGGGGQRGGLNASSIHDIMTVDEYVEFTPNSNQQDSSGSGSSSSGVSSGSSTPVGGGPGAGSDHMGRLIVGSAARQAGSQQQRQLGARLATDPSQRGRDYERDRQASNDIELERERNHGHHASGGGAGFGAGLFSGFHTGGKDRAAYDGAPTIKLDWLDDGNNEYKLRDIHFHWGERRDNGSEHAIDGRRAAMEMHLVHIKHGLDKSSIGFTSDSVAVIAVLIESHRKSNLDFNPIVNELAKINATDTPQEIDYKSLYDLLPNNVQSFYTYSGSLTTPPCYQVVNWIVMAERLNMNAKQIEMFRNLYAPPPPEQQHHQQNHNHHKDDNMAMVVDEMSPQHNQAGQGHNIGGAAGQPGAPGHYVPLELIMPNVRMLQPLNNRTILASFMKHGSRLESVTSSINSASLSSSIQIEHACLQLALGGALFVFQSFWRRRTLLVTLHRA